MKKCIGIAALASAIFFAGMGMAAARSTGPAASSTQGGWRCPRMSGVASAGQGGRHCPWRQGAGMRERRGASNAQGVGPQGRLGAGSGGGRAAATAPSSGQLQ